MSTNVREALTRKQAAADELLTRPEAAAYIGGLKPQTLACWASSKRYGLPLVKVGRSVRYRKSDLDAFLASRTVGEHA